MFRATEVINGLSNFSQVINRVAKIAGNKVRPGFGKSTRLFLESPSGNATCKIMTPWVHYSNLGKTGVKTIPFLAMMVPILYILSNNVNSVRTFQEKESGRTTPGICPLHEVYLLNFRSYVFEKFKSPFVSLHFFFAIILFN